MNATSVAIDKIANEALEHADTGCSAICPSRVFFAPIPASPGKHRIFLEYLNSSGQVIGSAERVIVPDKTAGMAGIFSVPY
jgi:hypothetical protein